MHSKEKQTAIVDLALGARELVLAGPVALQSSWLCCYKFVSWAALLLCVMLLFVQPELHRRLQSSSLLGPVRGTPHQAQNLLLQYPQGQRTQAFLWVQVLAYYCTKTIHTPNLRGVLVHQLHQGLEALEIDIVVQSSHLCSMSISTPVHDPWPLWICTPSINPMSCIWHLFLISEEVQNF